MLQERVVQNHCFRHSGGQEGRLLLGRTDPSASRSAPPRPASSPAVRWAALTRCGMSGFWIRQILQGFDKEGCSITNSRLVLFPTVAACSGSPFPVPYRHNPYRLTQPAAAGLDEAIRWNPYPPRVARPPLCVPFCLASPYLAREMSLFWIRHVLDEKTIELSSADQIS